MAATTIARATLTDSVSAITGDIWNAALVGTALYDPIDALFTASLTIARSGSGDIAFTCQNLSNTAGSDSSLVVSVAGTSAGDPVVQCIVTSGATFTFGVDNSDSDRCKIAASATLGTSDVFAISTAGLLCVGNSVTTNANMTAGLTLNQSSADDELLALKSTDVAHGMTSVTETNTYGRLLKAIAASGGLLVDGYRGTAGATEDSYGLQLRGAIAATANTNKNTGATGVIDITARTKTGTTVTSIGANGNIVVFTDNGTTRFILDADGDSHQDVGTAWTNFDDHEDVKLLHALSAGVSRPGDPVRESFGHFLKGRKRQLQALKLVTFNRDGHHFVNMSRLTMLLVGAVRQQAADYATLERRVVKAERRLAA